ncbi:MAG: ATP-binding cassette domain-containing protein, partial [Promethearchaeota archaeon]
MDLLAEWVRNRRFDRLVVACVGTTKNGVPVNFQGTLLKTQGNFFPQDYLVVDAPEYRAGGRVVPTRQLFVVNTSLGRKSLSSRIRGRKRAELDDGTVVPTTLKVVNKFVKDMGEKVYFAGRQTRELFSWLATTSQSFDVEAFAVGDLLIRDESIPVVVKGYAHPGAHETDSFFLTVGEIHPLNLEPIQVSASLREKDPEPTAVSEHQVLDAHLQTTIPRYFDLLVSNTKKGVTLRPRHIVLEISGEKRFTDYILEVKNLTVGFGRGKKRKVVVRDANFALEQGKIMGIIGESGAGKSTTLKAILGEIPYEGEIKIMGGQV